MTTYMGGYYDYIRTYRHTYAPIRVLRTCMHLYLYLSYSAVQVSCLGRAPHVLCWGGNK